ncbi:MAG: AbrB/MazE/SpoVT family DNA-binding domain-containing protein [Alphaproteobacteria bacterium]|nr:AbrB/MazE/SpoVT family DNA-binding domain-containing protein [Alphaproteobacteria bacterium]
MVTSKLTAKAQTTIPRAVRAALDLKAGDVLGYEVEGDHVVVRKLHKVDLGYLRAVEATLEEWSSKEDADAYDKL